MRLSSIKGFTLIELLVVVSIIGVLATIVLGALGDARAHARDARRHSDIKTIQNQLEIYYLDNGNYPVNTGWVSSNEPEWSDLETALGIEVPVDPLNTAPVSGIVVASSQNYIYSYYARGYGCQGDWYMIMYRLEGDPSPFSPGVDTCNGYTFNGYAGVSVRGYSPVQ